MVPLSPDLVRHINVTSGTFVGSVGLLRDGGKLDWPHVLQRSVFDKTALGGMYRASRVRGETATLRTPKTTKIAWLTHRGTRL